MKRLQAIPLICYAFFIAAWIVDLFTPQLFVAAILLNGPIALSGLALDTRLTTILVVAAQIANVVAGYVNGVQEHYHWNTIAVGDRVLSAASFLLVGYLTIRAQEYARDAGSATERARIATREKALRRSLESVRSTLNVELAFRAIAREARALFDADEALLIVRASQLDLPDRYCSKRGEQDVGIDRRPLDSALASLLERVSGDAASRVEGESDPVGLMVLESHHANAALWTRLRGSEPASALFLFGTSFDSGSGRMLQAFAEGASVALEQAHLFMQLGYRNEEIVAQRDALERSSRVIRDIVYALAHDLRTPLTAANVTMQQALDGKYGGLPDRYVQVLRTTIASNADARRLVDALLLIARLESGESSTLRELVDLGEQVLRVGDELRAVADAKSVSLRAEAQSGTVTLGDATEFRRAVTNLVANAIEATLPGGTVTMRVQDDGSVARVSVEDDGPGVPSERQRNLFERFGNAGHGTGSGLGLYIVRLIAEKYGGRVEYAPREPQGSRFAIVIPTVREPASA